MLGLLEMFYAPGRVFDRVRDQKLWGAPMIVIPILVLIGAVALINTIGIETMTRKQIESNPTAAAQLGPDGIEKRVAMANTPVVKAISYIVPPLFASVALLAVAGVLLGAMTITGSVMRYPQALGTVGYSWFPVSVVGTAMLILTVLISPNKEDINLKNPVATNVAAFLDPQTTSKFLYSLAASLDILTFAQIALIVYGLSRVGRAPIGRCAAVVIGLWALFVVIKSSISGLF